MGVVLTAFKTRWQKLGYPLLRHENQVQQAGAETTRLLRRGSKGTRVSWLTRSPRRVRAFPQSQVLSSKLRDPLAIRVQNGQTSTLVSWDNLVVVSLVHQTRRVSNATADSVSA